ncbi:hypothetical protein GC167_06105 [bacterium]|nr:hypothetical protein [bacterium]
MILSVLCSSNEVWAQIDPWDGNIVFSLSSGQDSVSPFTPPAGNGSSPASPTGKRTLYWIHGLGGGVKSWGTLAAATQAGGAPDYAARNVRSVVPVYDQYGSLNTAAISMEWFIDPLASVPSWDSIPRSRHIAIAHSQGGLVARKHAQMAERGALNRQYGGIVAFGTPHRGAVLLNNANPNGSYPLGQFVQTGCQVMSNAELTNLMRQNFWTDLLVSQSTISEISASACNAFANTLLPLMLKDLNQPITRDYRWGADSLWALNQDTLSIPIAAAYGVEDAPVFWRTMGSFLLNDTTISHNPFGADNDQAAVDAANQMMAHYWGQSEFFKGRYNYWKRRRGFVPFASRNTWKAWDQHQANLRAHEWIRDANDQWERLIGALKDTLYQGEYLCICRPASRALRATRVSRVPTESDCIPINGSETCTTYPYIHPVQIRKPNDGVVLAESAAGLPHFVEPIKMPHTNHQQMRNSSETRRVLNGLFNGEWNPSSYGFFKTKPR